MARTDPPSNHAPSPPATVDEDEKPIGPPIIDPEHHEDFPVFRETFLYRIAGADSNGALRAFGDLFYQLILEYWENWPPQPEGTLRGGLRAAVADLRHVQGFLLELMGPEASFETPHEEHLARVGGEVALQVARLADRLETEMGPWRGEAG